MPWHSSGLMEFLLYHLQKVSENWVWGLVKEGILGSFKYIYKQRCCWHLGYGLNWKIIKRKKNNFSSPPPPVVQNFEMNKLNHSALGHTFQKICNVLWSTNTLSSGTNRVNIWKRKWLSDDPTRVEMISHLENIGLL